MIQIKQAPSAEKSSEGLSCSALHLYSSKPTSEPPTCSSFTSPGGHVLRGEAPQPSSKAEGARGSEEEIVVGNLQQRRMRTRRRGVEWSALRVVSGAPGGAGLET